jgi:hypothetical protein
MNKFLVNKTLLATHSTALTSLPIVHMGSKKHIFEEIANHGSPKWLFCGKMTCGILDGREGRIKPTLKFNGAPATR